MSRYADPALATAAWLRHGAPPAKVAAAMLLCRHPGAFCFADGWCHAGGDCFHAYRQQIQRRQRPLSDMELWSH